MIEDPATVMAGICTFLGMPFDPRIASLQDSDRSLIYPGSHHNQVKSEKIVRSRERPEVLSPCLRRKIQRYTSYWQAQYGGTWPRDPKFQQGTLDHPS